MTDATARTGVRAHADWRWLPALALAGLVGLCAAWYVAANRDLPGVSAPVMPLDDAYIHFQYAHSLADGHPFAYNPDQPPTSGATSLLYPPILAIAVAFGFRGETLAYPALLVGVLCWFGAAWLVFRISSRLGAAGWLALGVAAAFALQGSLAWAFLSGMETGLFIFLVLWALDGLLVGGGRRAVLAGTLAALVRPEGALIGGIAALKVALSADRLPVSRRRKLARAALPLAFPILAALVQPMLNLLLTGSATASGMQAKSYLYNVPPDAGNMLRAVLETFWRIGRDLFSDPGYFTLVVALLALAGVLVALRQGVRRGVVLVVLGWLLGVAAMVATLETAFWQFKRYQQPMIALLFPLAALALVWMARRSRIAALVGVAALLAAALHSVVVFRGYYADNVREVASSQLPMARFVAENLPPGAVVGVHDIGVMRLLGGHDTYDVVGLTTPGAARPWRNGPGAVYEQMRRSEWRPDFFAIYPDARGLTYFQGTGLFREQIASFPSTAPPVNVASATNSGQNVYRADWSASVNAGSPAQPSSLAAIAGLAQVDSLNVADLLDEDAHSYRWQQLAQRPGFATEVYEQDYIACGLPGGEAACRILDGGRLITGSESMRITARPGEDLIWIMRVHPRNAATLHLYVDDELVGVRVVPAVPGRWLEIASYVPGRMIRAEQIEVRVEANISDPAAGHYMPYYHWFYQGEFAPEDETRLPGPGARFGESITLLGRRVTYDEASHTLVIDLEWRLDAPEAVDAVTFIHLYGTDGQLLEEAQGDRRPGQGAQPPANWLPGVLRDSYTVNVPESAPPGRYRVAIGLYDPVTGARFPVTGEGADADRRLFIGEIDVR